MTEDLLSEALQELGILFSLDYTVVHHLVMCVIMIIRNTANYYVCYNNKNMCQFGFRVKFKIIFMSDAIGRLDCSPLLYIDC